jgi:hypothetical protein
MQQQGDTQAVVLRPDESTQHRKPQGSKKKTMWDGAKFICLYVAKIRKVVTTRQPNDKPGDEAVAAQPRR